MLPSPACCFLVASAATCLETHLRSCPRRQYCALGVLMVLLLGGCSDADPPQPERSPVTASQAESARGDTAAARMIAAGQSPVPPWDVGPRQPDVELPLQLVNTNPGYVGAEQCRECHEARWQEFQSTRHAQACCIPPTDPPLPGFRSTAAPLSLPAHLPHVQFQLSRAGGQHVVSVLRPGAESQGAAVAALPVSLAFGFGGTADEVYFAWQGRQLRELPIGWLHPQQAWGVQQFCSPSDPGDFSRVTTTRCMECHNTWFEHQKGTVNEYRPDSFLLGVTCERCHGPGQEHVAWHRAHPEQRTAAAIVHPGQLSRDRLMDLCAQCHSSTIFRRTELFSYRPGDDLSHHFREHQNPHFEDDHVASQVKYLKQSRCYQNSETLSCITCHAPHHTQSAAEQGRTACQTCHQPTDCGERSRLPAAVQDQCAACHMPRYSRLAVRFHLADDRYVFPVRPTQHRIAVYPEARDAVLLEWHVQQSDPASQALAGQLRTRLTEFWLQRASEYRRQHRLIAAIGATRDALRLDPASSARTQLSELLAIQTQVDQLFAEALQLQEQRRFAEAVHVLQALLQIKPDHAMALAKLGTFQAILGDAAAATTSLQASVQHDPDNSYGDNMQGWLAYLRGDAAVAVEHFQRAEEIYPSTAENNYRWGLALLQLQQWEAARQRLSSALQIAPRDVAASRALVQALLPLGRPAEALKYAYHAAALSEFRDPQVQLELIDAYQAAGYPAAAAGAARFTLSLPEAGDAAVQAALRQRLRALQGTDSEP